MEFSLTVIIIIAVAVLLLKIAKSACSNLIGVILLSSLVLGFMYYKGLGPFKENVADLKTLNAKYCGPNGDEDICDCILKYASEDMHKRFISKELDSLENQKIRSAYVLQKSLSATKEQALICLASKDATDKYKVFLQDFVPIDNKYFEMIGETARDLGEKLKDEVNSLQENKNDIDEKY